jgi:hypothetical protein
LSSTVETLRYSERNCGRSDCVFSSSFSS